MKSIEHAKVLKAHAVLQGLCANLVNALKFFANQQEDGDGLLQIFVKEQGKESRKGLPDGLREFIKVDNELALDVGRLNRGTGTFKVRNPKVPEGCPEVIVSENPDELTLRAEEGGTSKARMNVDHIEPERWGPLVDADCCAFCQALHKGIEGEDWEAMYESYKEMSRAVEVKKPQEAQKAKALQKLKAAKDAREEYCDPMREEGIKGRNETRLALWEEHLEAPIFALDKALKCVEDQY